MEQFGQCGSLETSAENKQTKTESRILQKVEFSQNRDRGESPCVHYSC